MDTNAGILMKKLSLDVVMDFIDDQVDHHEGEARDVLVKACDIIYAYVHKDDDDEKETNHD